MNKEDFHCLIDEIIGHATHTNKNLNYSHPDYWMILGEDKDVIIPLIMEDIKNGSKLIWFGTLKHHTKEDLTKNCNQDNISEMENVWLEWGIQNRYIT